ncbi:MAG: PAS domain-containing protein [Bacteroidales bacterium]|nr:PAS domain-containing protein [Bacteroidales bacterium]MBN2749907.1 PAS domain-containing protein [Bacteroidales bacterium]
MDNKKSKNPKQVKPKSTRLLTQATALPNPTLFPIVGIGASAGGLDALEQFLSNVPPSSGMAFVVIQHLDPTQKGMLPELLQRVTTMKVLLAKNRLVVKPNCVYVIPPNKSMSILNGALLLFSPIEPRGLRLPIDFFFRSLADDRKELGVGLVLSGMGSDGSVGLCAIKERNGMVAVQEPSTAQFDSMPRNAIDSTPVDIVAPPNELPHKILEFFKQMPLASSNLDQEIKDKSSLEKIIILLRSFTGNDFSLYKKSTVYRRIERRMGVHKVGKISSYVQFLQENPKEIEILFKEIMIGVTSFFRDSSVWEKLAERVLPDLIANLPSGSNLRAWIPACSSGEEAYSMAIVFKEVLAKLNPPRRISLQVFATDLDNDAIEIARKGVFPINIAADVSPDRLAQFFYKTEDGYRINSDIREMVVFAQHNLIMHPPFTKIDILSCRNLLIYMEPELQKKILRLFYYSLNTNGVMLLGSSETLGAMSHLFVPIDAKFKLYKPLANVHEPDVFSFPSSFVHGNPGNAIKPEASLPPPNIQSLADQVLLEHFAPPSVLVNQNGDIVYITGRTGKYLEPAAGKANLNIFVMLREGIRNEFHVAFNQVIRNNASVVLRNLRVRTNDSTQLLNLAIHWIDKPEPLIGLIMVTFNDIPEVTPPKLPKGKKSVGHYKTEELEKELQNIREEMQTSVEEMQASQEELKSANEELQSSNEELQSTNEELTSSKEEMQSLNEEFQTVNSELMAKVEEFARVDNDMKNLLNSTDIATLFLDKDLNIRRYTNQATKIFKLIKSDIGRPFTDLVSDIMYPQMADDANEVLSSLVLIEKQIPSKDGRWFSIRIMPYRTFDDRIDGLVITFINITELKTVEDKLNEAESVIELLSSSAANAVVRLSAKGIIEAFNPSAELLFGSKKNEAIGNNFVELFVPVPLRKKAVSSLHKLLSSSQNTKIILNIQPVTGEILEVEWAASILLNKLKISTGVILMASPKPFPKNNKL